MDEMMMQSSIRASIRTNKSPFRGEYTWISEPLALKNTNIP